MKVKPVVAIIGRPNVGKSTLFNALAKKNIAIIHDLPGVTRDRNYTDIIWDEFSFTLVDTGGFDPGLKDEMATLVFEHAQVAVEEADLILFLLDVKEGLQFADFDIARLLIKSNKPVLYVVNKVENNFDQENAFEFYSLGTDEIITISAKNRIGISKLLEHILKNIPQICHSHYHKDEIIVSIVGRPNVGKSSFVNKMLGYKRLMVSDKAGTTRDPVDSLIRYNNRIIRFIDTAGIRKKNTITFSLEKYCVFQALKSINRSSICILMLDATQGITTQDAKIASQIYDRKRACIIVINKWDLLTKNIKSHDTFIREVSGILSFINYSPMVTVSALTGLRVRKILDIILDLDIVFNKRVTTSFLNKGISKIIEHNPPPRSNRSKVKIYFATQVDTAPPFIKLFTNYPSALPDHYKRYLEKSLRELLDFKGIPICLQFEKHSV